MHLVRRATFVLGACLAVSAVARTPAGEKENPLITQVKGSVKDATKPFTLVVRFKVKEDAVAKFEAEFAKAIKKTRAEKGCLAYELNRDAKTPGQYLLYERWQNVESLEAHLKAPHITGLLGQVGAMMDGPPEGQIFVPVGGAAAKKETPKP
jgi:quinol monooxygenase YgiN